MLEEWGIRRFFASGRNRVYTVSSKEEAEDICLSLNEVHTIPSEVVYKSQTGDWLPALVSSHTEKQNLEQALYDEQELYKQLEDKLLRTQQELANYKQHDEVVDDTLDKWFELIAYIKNNGCWRFDNGSWSIRVAPLIDIIDE